MTPAIDILPIAMRLFALSAASGAHQIHAENAIALHHAMDLQYKLQRPAHDCGGLGCGFQPCICDPD